MRIIFVLTLLFAFSYLPAQVYYVDVNASGANNGTSWTDAFSDLQVAINTLAAASGGELWVKAGLYAPSMDQTGNSTPTDSRTKTFSANGVTSPNVTIYGGFAGNETLLNQRNIPVNVTYLTGLFDLNYHIVSVLNADESFIIDGVTIEFGYANSTATTFTGRGGGIFSDASAAVFRNCTLSNNFALEGGGVYSRASSITFEDCTFEQNTAYGGSYSAQIYFGDLASTSGTPTTFKTCTFQSNSLMGGTPSLSGLVELDSYTLYEDCIFKDNDCSACGGLLYSSKTLPVTTTDITFRNCLIYDNYTNNGIGTSGCLGHYAGSLKMENCTAYGNSNSSGHFIQASGSASAIVSNSIFWNLSTELFYSVVYDGLYVYNSIIKGTIPSGVGGNTNLENIDPLFEDVSSDNYNLKPCSPGYNNGNNSYVNTSKDIDGNGRTMYSTVDIGAYEIQTERNLVNSAEEVLAADEEVTLSDGWTSYYDCDGNTLLLSVKKNGTNIGIVGDGSFEMKVQTNEDYAQGAAVDLSSANYVESTSFFASNKSWTLTPSTQPTANVGVRFYYTAKDISDVNGSYPISRIEDAVLYKVPGTNAYDLSVSTANYQQYIYDSGSPSTTTFDIGQENGMDYVEFEAASFSSGAIGAGDGINGGALPIELFYFDVKKINEEHAQIDFQLFADMSSKISVERSKDGRVWENLHDIYITAGNQTKRYLDEDPWTGDNYYRLAMLEIPTEDLTYSPTRLLNLSGVSSIKLKSNLIKDQSIFLELREPPVSKLTGQVYNEQGQVVWLFSLDRAGIQEVEINKALPSGTYWISISQEGRPIYQDKFVRIRM